MLAIQKSLCIKSNRASCGGDFLGLESIPKEENGNRNKKLFSHVFINNRLLVTCKLVNAVNVCLWFQEWNKNLGATQDPSITQKNKSVISVNESADKSFYTKKYLIYILYFV